MTPTVAAPPAREKSARAAGTMMSNRPAGEANAASAKYVRLSRQLAERIQAGEWGGGRMPTVREIALAYQVSSFTASRALHLLQERGLVVTKERSGCFVAPVSPAITDRWAVVSRDGLGFDPTASDDTFVPVALASSPDETVRAVTEAGVLGVIFRPAAGEDGEAFVAECRSAGLPVVRIGEGDGSPTADTVVGDEPSEVARWAVRLLRVRLDEPAGRPVRVVI